MKLLLPLIDKNLTARSARSRVAHLPEVIFISHALDSACIHVLLPELKRLIIALMHCDPKHLFGESKHLRDKLPRMINRLLLEVIPKREVPQHLKECMVPTGVADILQVVVLASCADAKLTASRPRIGWCRDFTREDIFELNHACIGEKQGRIIRNQGHAFINRMPLGGEIVKEELSNIHGETLLMAYDKSRDSNQLVVTTI